MPRVRDGTTCFFSCIFFVTVAKLIIGSCASPSVARPLETSVLTAHILRCIASCIGFRCALYRWSEGFTFQRYYCIVILQTITTLLMNLHACNVVLILWAISERHPEPEVYGSLLPLLISLPVEMAVYAAGHAFISRWSFPDEVEASGIPVDNSIYQLPYRRVHVDSLATKEDDTLFCMICLESLIYPVALMDDEVPSRARVLDQPCHIAARLSCGHAFHEDCIDRWLARSPEIDCPLRCQAKTQRARSPWTSQPASSGGATNRDGSPRIVRQASETWASRASAAVLDRHLDGGARPPVVQPRCGCRHLLQLSHPCSSVVLDEVRAHRNSFAKMRSSSIVLARALRVHDDFTRDMQRTISERQII
eukprot:TRINITY_DN73421_c0_g1_i1.p1 TRINITY_DN73421_c0_g1~~TRINITY_DN73421_c0_g1_i1.p1  ORF type:complete len:365 (-),score=22.36 TRINITY_DN73421_c0_g1_i1:198-1292(-)